MYNNLRWIINNYYLIFVFLGLETFLGFIDLYSAVILLVFVVMLYAISYKPIKYNTIDFLIFLFVFYQLISYIFSDYMFDIYYYGVKAQIVPMFFYFIGRSRLFVDNKFLDKMKYPMMFAFIVGLFLYFFPTNWYIEKRTANLAADASISMYYERTRLSSFWFSSYAMGYGSLYFIMYYLKDLFTKYIKMNTIISLIIALLVLFFAQHRVSIVFLFFYVCMITFFMSEYKKNILYIWFFILLSIILIAVWLFNYADSDFLAYVLNRSIESDDNIVVERVDMFGDFFNISTTGEGLGKYGHAALMYNKKSITDCEYIRLIVELGIVGCTIFGLIYINLLLKAYKNIKIYIFELGVLIFFLVAMIGAAPLESNAMQPFLFWYCAGRINNIYCIKHINQKK